MQAMVQAQGKVLALLATIMDRSGIVPVAEFGDLLALLATISGETASEEGLILGHWAATIRETAAALDDKPEG